MTAIGADRVEELLAREQERFVAEHPRSHELHERAKDSQLSGVPMNWMTHWRGKHPVFVAEAHGAELTDVDGHTYVDLCLGDTGAMTGHSPEPTVSALREQGAHGITTMLPSEPGIAAAEQLRDRFGVPNWQFTVSATDANRFAIRICRQITGRSKVLVHNRCYHGTVDESFATLGSGGEVQPRHGSVGPPVPPAETTRVVEINDLEALERELGAGDVAVALVEPALTNVGIVLPEPGYHDALRRLTREHGTLLIIDETHTFCCGPGGYTAAHGLEPDLVTIGKAIAGGVPTGAFGMSAETAERVLADKDWVDAHAGGVGGTLAGNSLSLAATADTLAEVLTAEAFEHMIALGERYEGGVAGVIAAHELPWTVSRLGCRVEYMFAPEPPRTGSEAAEAEVRWEALDSLMHLRMLNEGILLTPFHMMALMCPATTEEQVDRHTAAFTAIVEELVAT
jgi:glutamate-1-semialdehyde 2,1-aminomutase